MPNIQKILNLELGDKSYPIYIGNDLLSDKSYLEKHISGQQVMVITNTTIEPLYLEKVKNYSVISKFRLSFFLMENNIKLWKRLILYLTLY